MNVAPDKPTGVERCAKCGGSLSQTKVGRRLQLLGVSFRDAHIQFGVRQTLLTRMAVGYRVADGSRVECMAFLTQIGLSIEDIDQPWPDREESCAGD
jgi:hypothetical protein